MRLGPGSKVNARVIEKDGELVLGSNSYINSGLIRAIKGNIVIGNDCTISYNVFMVTNYRSHLQPDLPGEDIVIGNNVWIGYGSMIRGGVTIGDGAVIGMGSVVTENVPAGWMVAGNPAKRKKRVKPGEEQNDQEQG